LTVDDRRRREAPQGLWRAPLKRRLLSLCLAFSVALGLGLWLARDLVLDGLYELGLVSSAHLGLSPWLATDLVLINLADTRSAYYNYPRVLSVVERIVQEHEGTPTYILFNGNLFGQGNVVASRSRGEIDWAFLKALRSHAPVIFNIGARDFDFMEPEEFVREARAEGITVISNLRDSASDSFIASAVTTLTAGEERLVVVGLARASLSDYRREVRPQLAPPDPLLWLTGSGVLLVSAGHPFVLLSQAGVGRDREMLRAVPRRTLVVGGHRRLVFRGRQGLHSPIYMHNGAYGEKVNVTRVSFAGGSVRMGFEDYLIAADTPPDSELQTLIERVEEAWLEPEDLLVVGTMERAYTVAEAARWAVEALREVSGADVAVLDKDFFDAGLPGGPLTKYRFDTFLPSDSDVMWATVDAATLERMISRANLSASTPLENLGGNFIYASEIIPQGGKRYTLVTSERVAQGAEWLLRTTEIAFELVPETTVKALLAEALNRELR
jgi:hypothetical protein